MSVLCNDTDSKSWSTGAEYHRDSMSQAMRSIEREVGPSTSRAIKSEPYDDVNRKLTYSSSPRSRHQRPPTLQVLPKASSSPRTATAISGSYNTFTFNSQDVHHLPVNVSSVSKFNNPTSAPSNVSSNPHRSSLVSRPPPPAQHHVPIDPRPRTATQVFLNTSDLAAHYGIPTFLPPAPRTIPRRESHHTESSPEADFQNICSNYLTMLSNTPDDTTHAEDTAMAPSSVPTVDPEFPPASKQQEAVQELMDVFQASPEFNFEDAMSEYLTSPMNDSPLDDELLQTPALNPDDYGADIYNSPLMGDWPYTESYEGSLFNDQYNFLQDTAPAKQPAPATVSPANIDLSTMWSLSPATPALEASPLPLPVKALPTPTHTRRKSSATGTRKNVTPETLVPIDAPTQTRKYVTPSVTSRKEVPAVFARKRARSQAFGDEQDELEEDMVTLPPNPTEADLIEAKRRQNTIAARRSRKRKLEYQRELEDTVDQVKEERDMWKNRAMTYQALLNSHGIAAPDL